MPYANTGIDITRPAAADLSTYQFRLMAVDANGRATAAVAVTDPIIGILQNKPAGADQAAVIRIAGVSKCAFGAAVNEGAWITCGVEGYGTATTTANDVIVGMALHAPGGSGDVQDLLVILGRL